MKTCKHIIENGIDSIPSASGDYCIYCAQENIEKIKCTDANCPDASNYTEPHWHPWDAEGFLEGNVR